MSLKGPLVSLMLLLVSLGHRAMDAHCVHSDNCLKIRLVAEESSIYWIVAWPPDADCIKAEEESADEMDLHIRDAMISQLTRECFAVLQENKTLGQYHLTLPGDVWSASCLS